MKTYNIDMDFYSLEFKVKAKNKRDARKKAMKALVRKIRRAVKNVYIDEDY